jgi:hypothetical protein
MTPSAFAGMIAGAYPSFRLHHMFPGNSQYEPVRRELKELVTRSGGMFTMEDVGRSVEGRTISLVRAGTGPRRVMLWSQMHGDEPTATLALLDIMNGMIGWKVEPWFIAMLQDISIVIIPLLNPDGAERRERLNAAGININRDALALASPEAQVLHAMHERFRPDFGFNLHDQELSSVGDAPVPTSLALLAPPPTADKQMTSTRLRAIRLAAHIARTVGPHAEGNITRYDDAFEPRAFGDWFQAAGTSTVLIESGHRAHDPEKAFSRKLNVIGILSALRSIANHSFPDTELDQYHHLPLNGKRVFDVLLRGVELQHQGVWSQTVDVGLAFQKDHANVLVKEIGDLHTHGGLDVIEVARRVVSTEHLRVNRIVPTKELFDLLQMYANFPPVAFRP